MSIRLINEVLDYAPADLTPPERLLLVVLAEAADDKTRRCWPGRDVLANRVGVTERHISRLLTLLESRGYQLRIATGVDKHGRPTAAAKGHRAIYELPKFRKSKGDAQVPL